MFNPYSKQNVNQEKICDNSHPLQQDFLLSTFKGILYHFFFLGRSRSRVVDLFPFTWSSSLVSSKELVSLKEPLFLLLLVLRFIGGAIVYDACISFLCLRSSSICETNKQQDSSKMQSVIVRNYQCTETSFPKWSLGIMSSLVKLTACFSSAYRLVISVNCAITCQHGNLCQNQSTLVFEN